MNKVGEALITVMVMCGVFYGILVLLNAPNKKYITRINIEGREVCFHGNSSQDIYYYEIWFGLHSHATHVVNEDETLDDEIEKLAKEYKSYDGLTSRYKKDE